MSAASTHAPLSRYVCFILLAACIAAAPANSPGDRLIESLDLSRPELAEVKKAWDAGDIAAARRAFANHLRTRKTIVWKEDLPYHSNRRPRANLAVADDALKHRFESVDIVWQFDGPIDWKFNPTAVEGTKLALNHEWTWQFNRHRYWPILAEAYRQTGDARYARELSDEILDWVEKNPAPAKVNNARFSTWRTIEAGIRMFGSWPETFFMMVDSKEGFPDDTLLAMVLCMRDHAAYLSQFPSGGGNWKSMESNGLFHVGTLFPEFKDAAQWREQGLARQREELDRQFYPDGTQIELSPHYHNVALRNFAQTYVLAKQNKINVPAGYQLAMEKFFDVNLRAMLPDRTMPQFNDSGREPVIPMLRRGLEVFPERADWKWIVSGGNEGSAPTETSHFFPYAGWAVMRSGWDKDARAMVFEAGPFGYGHQHEDKLSFVLDAYGSRLVAEAGIFTYDASEMRKYVLSARGHNVISVDGLGQVRRGEDRNKYVVTEPPADVVWKSEADFDFAQGSYGKNFDEKWGPKRVSGFTHTRRILFAKPDYWVVIDTINPDDTRGHVYESVFHLDASDARIDESAASVTTTNADRANITVIPLAGDGLELRVIKGETEPQMRGWIADNAYDTRPVPTALFTKKKTGPATFLYVFAPIPAGKSSPIQRVEPAKIPDAQTAATIVFTEDAAYGKDADTVWMDANGTVHIKRSDGKTFTSVKE